MPLVSVSERILVVKLSSIGDVLMASPVSRALRRAFPESYIAWVVERKSADVVLGNPFLDEVFVLDRTKGGNAVKDASQFVSNILQLRDDIRAHQFDVCIDLQGLIRSAFVSWMSGARLRVGFADAGEGAVYLYHERYRPASGDLNAQQRNLDILSTLGVYSTDTAMYMPVGDDDRSFAAGFFERTGLSGAKTVALCPATTWVNKHWITERWSAVADLLWEKYHAKSVIMGSKADLPMAAEIASGAHSKPVVSVGQTTLKQAGAIMEKCVAVIGVDTGLLHMAVALDKPAVGLFGASAWHCFTKKENFVWVAKEFPCSPCHRHPTCTDVDCMRAIMPEDVESGVRRWLE